MSFKRELHPDPGPQLQPVININPKHQASMPAPWLKNLQLLFPVWSNPRAWPG
jgi:hypothetical protein